MVDLITTRLALHNPIWPSEAWTLDLINIDIEKPYNITIDGVKMKFSSMEIIYQIFAEKWSNITYI
jgi:hypothetical protein